MKTRLIVIGLLSALAMFSGCSLQPTRQAKAETSLQTEADEAHGSFAVGTLSAFGSFEFQQAPLNTQLARIRHNAAVHLRAGKISKAQAIDIQTKADELRHQLNTALLLCNQDDSTNRCRGDQAAAERISASVAASIADLK